MRCDPPMPHVALVVKCGNTAAFEGVAQELVRRMVQRRLVATWAIEAPGQAKSLAAWTRTIGAYDLALLCQPEANPGRAKVASDGFSQSLGRRVSSFLAAGIEVRTIHLAAAEPRIDCHRALHAMGIRAVVVEGAKKFQAVRALPFGLWQFAPQIIVPAVNRWLRWLGRSSRKAIDGVQPGVNLASIDLARLDARGALGWREADRLLQQLEEARRQGALDVTTVTAVANQLAETSAARPQRSILRAAA